jgi:hypothetical protein
VTVSVKSTMPSAGLGLVEAAVVCFSWRSPLEPLGAEPLAGVLARSSSSISVSKSSSPETSIRTGTLRSSRTRKLSRRNVDGGSSAGGGGAGAGTTGAVVDGAGRAARPIVAATVTAGLGVATA